MKIAQKLPKETKELLDNFRQYVAYLRIKKSYKMSHIFNMNETLVWFDMAGNFSVNQTGEKTVHIRETGNEKNQFTVVLTCGAGRFFLFYLFPFFLSLIFPLSFFIEGTKMLPICIFKGKRI